MTMAAFDGLQLLNLIVVTKDGYYDRTKMQGGLTRYRAGEEHRDVVKEAFNAMFQAIYNT